ncbi:hypothetical protein COY05_00980 [Candidatus Peregrinibacteria bacterium CG_4_10_14_0_2_um_filter_38_24]|nr:MAG: hypothetical protein COY05_00980 [Candidatus Peregrinibacteria bacterium CG_4_10_14_0_2_um_filter_38_24]PJC39023.1 MAG: hypothetical protein CO044_01995 [Candidatus Peregrinibacteria bacterium CG_4_9_14_0_2_um_filter_38_9]
MDIQDGAFKEILETWIDSRDTRPVDDQQRELTESVLLPNLDAIVVELMKLMKIFDIRIKGALKKMSKDLPPQYESDPSIRNPKNYPVGFYDTITDGVWVQIFRALKYPQTKGNSVPPGMQALRHFHARGGHLKQIAGIKGNSYQNALQAGALFVDVANDTVDKSESPVSICELDESGFTNMGGFAEAAEVTEQYWGHNVFPQRLFPFLTPFYPIVHVSPLGKVEILPTTKGMIAKNILADFSPAEDFVLRSRFAEERFPPKFHEKLGNLFSWDEDNYDFDEGRARGDIFYHGGAPDELIAEVFERVRNIDSEDLPKLIGGSIGDVRAFNQRGIRL